MLEALRDDEGCGSEDWEVVKVLGSGMSGQVRLQKTPCGLLHAVKEPPKGGNSIGSEKMLRQHIHVVLKHLASVVDGPKCDGCFPRYYYHSESSGSCYNEFVVRIPTLTVLCCCYDNLLYSFIAAVVVVVSTRTLSLSPSS